jgi:hypothetical protein
MTEKITREQFRNLIIKETKLLEQTMEIEKLINEKVYDAVLDGANGAITKFVKDDEQLEEFVSEYVYNKESFLDEIVDDASFMNRIIDYIEEKVSKKLSEKKDEIMKKFEDEKKEDEEE